MDSGECHEAHEVLQELVVARGYASEVFDFAEEALNGVALFVEHPIAGVGPSPVVARRDNWGRTSLQDCVMEVLCVIGPVSDHGLAGDVLDQVRSVEHITAMAGACDQADGIAKAVGGGVELGAEPAFRTAKTLGIRPPFSFRAPLAC